MSKFINLTPHEVRLNDGRIFLPVGKPARVGNTFTAFDSNSIASAKFGAVENLPEPETGTIYIVSLLVASAVRRADVVSPATGHPECVRKDGQVISVPGFIRSENL